MPSFETQNNFLGAMQQIKTGIDQTVIFHSILSTTHFETGLFSTYNIELPAALNSAVDKRKSEFLAGRAITAHAFTHLNIPWQNIPIGPKREPIWPNNVQGSITHTREYCACILSTVPNLYVGIDVEHLLSHNALRSVRHVAMTENDTQVEGSQATLSEQHFATLVFSAKETLYKALFPIAQSFFGFDAATIHGAPSDQKIRLQLTKTLHPTLTEGQVFTINHQFMDGKVLTWLAHQHTD